MFKVRENEGQFIIKTCITGIAYKRQERKTTIFEDSDFLFMSVGMTWAFVFS